MKHDKHLYELPLKSLFWYFRGERFPKEGIDRYEHGGKTFTRDDTFETELEAVYTMVVWLLENDLLDETKLRNYEQEQ